MVSKGLLNINDALIIDELPLITDIMGSNVGGCVCGCVCGGGGGGGGGMGSAHT